MKNLCHLYIILLMLFVPLVSGCGVNLVSATATPENSAPPVEGENNAPSLRSSAEDIIVDKNTPKGVCVKKAASGSLVCYDVNGRPLVTLQVPGIGSSDPQGMHIAGELTTGAAVPPVVYFSWEPEPALLVSANGSSTSFRKTSAFLALAGASGQPVMAFSDVAYDGNTTHSYLYAGTLQTLSGDDPFYDLKDKLTGMALMPLAVESSGGQAQKVWYTHTVWGIGGADLIYPINRGLYVFDLATGQNMQALNPERNFQGLSPDNTLAGSISFDFKGDHSLNVNNLVTGQMINFPLNLTSDRGAGFAVFSADGKYTAWLEASGSMITEPPNFKARIRTGDIASGVVNHEVDSDTAAKMLGWERLEFMKPVGWLDTKTLVIEARGNNWEEVSLLKYDLLSGSLTSLHPGSFSGFIY